MEKEISEKPVKSDKQPAKAKVITQAEFDLMTVDQKREFIKAKVDKAKIGDLDTFVAKDPELFDYMIKEMSTNKNAKRASELLAKHKKEFSKYPDLVVRLEKKAVRYIMGEQPWDQIELRLQSNKKLLALAAEDYFFQGNFGLQGKKDVAFTLVKKHNLDELINKDDLKIWLQTEEAKKMEILENTFIKNDKFGSKNSNLGPMSVTVHSDPKGEPMEPMSLEFIGYSEPQVILINTKPTLDHAMSKILASKRVGIDIETVPVILKFQEGIPSLLQLATSEEIFVIDLLSDEEGFGEYAFDRFANLICKNTDLLKIGQGLDNDVKVLKKRYHAEGQIVSSYD